MNRLFVANKPSGISCNNFLSKIKKRYNVKKAGFSGTLDPFASGVLIVAFGQYTKLFRFLNKAPKTYIATLWLGAKSQTLDIEKVEQVDVLEKFDISFIKDKIFELVGEISYYPPSYSAKKIDGQRAYKLARRGEEVDLKKISSNVTKIEIINYSHPFLTFKIEISEGGYVRSIANILSSKLSCNGCLSMLERLNEGGFYYENEKFILPQNMLSCKPALYNGDIKKLEYGAKLDRGMFANDNGYFYFIRENELSIFRLDNDSVTYEIHKIILEDS